MFFAGGVGVLMVLVRLRIVPSILLSVVSSLPCCLRMSCGWWSVFLFGVSVCWAFMVGGSCSISAQTEAASSLYVLSIHVILSSRLEICSLTSLISETIEFRISMISLCVSPFWSVVGLMCDAACA